MTPILGTIKLSLPCKVGKNHQEKVDDFITYIRRFITSEGCEWYHRDYHPKDNLNVDFLIDLLLEIKNILKDSDGDAQYQCFMWNTGDCLKSQERFQLSISSRLVDLPISKSIEISNKTKKQKRHSTFNDQIIDLALSVNENAKSCLPLPTKEKLSEENLDCPYNFSATISVLNIRSSKAIKIIQNYLQSNFQQFEIALSIQKEISSSISKSLKNQSFVRVPIDISVHNITVTKKIRLPVLKLSMYSDEVVEQKYLMHEAFMTDICSWFEAFLCSKYNCISNENDDSYASHYKLPKHLAFEKVTATLLQVSIQGFHLSHFQELLETHIRNLMSNNGFEFIAITKSQSCSSKAQHKMKIIVSEGSII